MIEHVWSIICKESKLDADTNQISIFDVYERITIDATPAPNVDVEKLDKYVFPVPHEITSTFYRDKAEGLETAEMRIRQLSPQGEELSSHLQPLQLGPGQTRLRTRVKSPALVVKSSGIYTFEISLGTGNGRFTKVAEIPLDIVARISER
jgi:hypothetical protein